MRTFYQHKSNCPSLNDTWTSLGPSKHSIQLQQNAYLSSVNYRLLVSFYHQFLQNQITDAQTQKNYYRTRLSQQYHSHHAELENAFTTISQKNQFIIQLQEQLDRMNKDYRVLSDEYVSLKNSFQGDKEVHQAEMSALKNSYEQKMQKMQDQAMVRLQVQINKRVQQVEQQCEKRVEMFKSQLQQARALSTQLAHQLKVLQQDYRQVMLKNDTMIQQSIQRQLRKRDFEAQSNYLRDVAQYEHMKKVNQELKDDLNSYMNKIQAFQKENKRLRAQNLVAQTKMKDLEEAFEEEKKNNRVKLEVKYKETEEIQTNTEQQFVPIVFPVQTNLVGQLVALKDFLSEKMIEKYEDFFTKASLKQKKKSASLITFKNFLAEQTKNARQNSLLVHVHTGLERIVKLYCPAMSYSREYLTVKDEFIRKTLMQCEGLTNKQQKLFRLLELIHRLRHPITHVKSEISTGELKMVELKILATLKKVFSSQ